MRNNLQRPANNPADAGGHLTEGLTRWRTIVVVGGTMLALLLAALDQTIVGTAMPRIVAAMEIEARKRQKKGAKTDLFKIMEKRDRDRLTSGIWARALKAKDPLATSPMDIRAFRESAP